MWKSSFKSHGKDSSMLVSDDCESTNFDNSTVFPEFCFFLI